jgi:replicative DNA helicase
MQSKVPPHDITAEKSVLGSILLDQEALVRVVEILARDDFYFDAHRVTYEAMLDLHRSHRPIDLTTLHARLTDRAELDAAGGISELASLTEYVPTASNAEEYARIIHGHATRRRIIAAGFEIQRLGFEDDAEPDVVRDRSEQLLSEIQRSHVRTKFDSLRDLFNDQYERMAAAMDDEASGTNRFLATGLSDLDRMLSGIEPSDLLILAARPAMGKTSLALTIAANVARRGKSVGIFSLEMSKEQLTNRILSSAAVVDGWKLRAGKLTTLEADNVAAVMERDADLPIYIVDTAGLTALELRSRARRLKATHGLDFIVVDYLQLMAGTNPNNRVQEVSEISRSLKALARELNVPILCLSQLSRAVEGRDNKVPNLSDLRESGQIEADADVVMMLFRDDYYREDSDRPGEVELHIKKHRNGPTGKVLLMFDAKTTTFRSIDSYHAGHGDSLPDAA